MKRVHNAVAAAAMVLMIIAVLITSFQVAAYGDPEYRFYEREYKKFKVTDSLDMEMDDVMKVTDYMMAYLIGDKEELSVVTDVDGRQQDFFNEQDRIHMADVRNLFMGGLNVRLFCLAMFAVLMVLLLVMRADWKRIIPRAYFAGVGVFLLIAAVLGVLFASDFTRYFTIFHEIFFTNDLWLFDPATDYMIRMLPEGFFSDMAARIGVTFVGSLAILGVLFYIWIVVCRRIRDTYKRT